ERGERRRPILDIWTPAEQLLGSCLGALRFPPGNNSPGGEEAAYDRSRRQKLSEVLRSLQHILQLHAFCQKRSLRKIVSDRNGRQENREDTADNEQAMTELRYQTGVGAAAPHGPGHHRSTGDQKGSEIEDKFHLGRKVNHKNSLVSRSATCNQCLSAARL